MRRSLNSGQFWTYENSICERMIGTIRRECLDWMLPMSEAHLRSILREWVVHYNGGRPHSALGPGVPGPPREAARVSKLGFRPPLAAGAIVLAKSVLGGLHHEYRIAVAPAGASSVQPPEVKRSQRAISLSESYGAPPDCISAEHSRPFASFGTRSELEGSARAICRGGGARSGDVASVMGSSYPCRQRQAVGKLHRDQPGSRMKDPVQLTARRMTIEGVS